MRKATMIGLMGIPPIEEDPNVVIINRSDVTELIAVMDVGFVMQIELEDGTHIYLKGSKDDIIKT